MKFLCLAYGSGEDWEKLSEQEQQSLLAQDEELRRRGDYVTAVEPAVTTVTNWDRVLTTTDGPFARSSVPLAGFGIIEADSLDQAIELVANTPCARANGAIEVRALYGQSAAEHVRA